MTYREYVLAAYAVFAAVLAWDYVAPRLRMAQLRRAARREAARRATAKQPLAGGLQR
ncbi:heme exporter protein CcmD [Luteimonas vadosa]|uniref:Heme exporter protein D n=1 Tax=Luteimonas vadosa TaxID=1165507 RepID=A0ABP9E0B2_9GAMM